ncbi:MAG: DUF6640 family protein [Myxococcota bacterium]
MDLAFDANLLPRILFTIVAAGIAIGPVFADFNATHATNPLWPPHARFHVVWQVLQQSSASLIALFLLWQSSAEYVLHLYVVAAILFTWVLTFFGTLSSMRIFAGALRDVNGIEPFRFPLGGGRVVEVDTNLFGASVFTVVLVIATLSIRSA